MNTTGVKNATRQVLNKKVVTFDQVRNHYRSAAFHTFSRHGSSGIDGFCPSAENLGVYYQVWWCTLSLLRGPTNATSPRQQATTKAKLRLASESIFKSWNNGRVSTCFDAKERDFYENIHNSLRNDCKRIAVVGNWKPTRRPTMDCINSPTHTDPISVSQLVTRNI